MSDILDNSAISKVLGQRVSAPARYDKSILVREPRQSNRTYLGIRDNALPFVGKDLWNNWEISALSTNGMPITGIAQIVYDCTSKYIVESKSAKLYFNSFNMTQLGDSSAEVSKNIEDYASKDLSELLESPVSVKIFSASAHNSRDTDLKEYSKYITLEDQEGVDEIKFNTYSENSGLLVINKSNTTQEQYFRSTLLRSNCRVTNQPDHGDVYIYLKSKNKITPESLIQYIVSFRNECHFHEEICEAIYKRILDLCEPEELRVSCYYVRRGSLDINPVRATHEYLLEDYLLDTNIRFCKTPRQ